MIYAVWREGEQRVGDGTRTYQDALKWVDKNVEHYWPEDSKVGLKEAREATETYRNAQRPDWSILTEAKVAIILDDRITELEGQRNLLFAAAEEMLKIVECTEFESDDDAPDNDEMNRWHRALQI